MEDERRDSLLVNNQNCLYYGSRCLAKIHKYLKTKPICVMCIEIMLILHRDIFCSFYINFLICCYISYLS